MHTFRRTFLELLIKHPITYIGLGEKSSQVYFNSWCKEDTAITHKYTEEG